jgi:hydroxymethylpyrimidine pyrophosphatase-like HAD family hydrolase
VNGRPPLKALLACDLDGTLLAADGSPAPGIVAALADLDARGARLVVGTGRPLHGAVKATAILHADPVAYVCYHGALAIDVTTGKWLRHLTIPADAASGIVREAHLLGLSVTLYDGDERRELVAPAAFGAALDLPASAGITRLVLCGDPVRVAAAYPGLAASWGLGLRMDHAGDGIVDVIHAGADKGDSLRLVAAHLGVPAERIVACGDAAADETLLRSAAIRIAVGDAPASLRDAAQLVVSQDALSGALRRAADSLV